MGADGVNNITELKYLLEPDKEARKRNQENAEGYRPSTGLLSLSLPIVATQISVNQIPNRTAPSA